MRNKSLFILAVVTIIVIIAATFSSRQRAPRTSVETPLLYPDLIGRVNDVTAISVERGSESVHISREGNDWRVVEADNFPARFQIVKKTVLNLAGATILSEKTDNPAMFSELGVEDHTVTDAGSILLTLKGDSGEVLASLLYGNPGTSSATSSTVYVRKAGTNETYLVKGTGTPAARIQDWIVTGIADIAEDRIMDVSIRHGDGDSVTLRREKGSEDFLAIDLPEGKKSRAGYYTRQPASALTELTIENARSLSDFSFPEPPAETRVRTYDGLVADFRSAKIDGINYMTVSFSVDEELLQATESTTTDSTIVIGDKPAPAVDVRKEAADLNALTAGKVFVIPLQKYLQLTKRFSELTDDIVAEADTASGEQP